jgi:hypothetical protein
MGKRSRTVATRHKRRLDLEKSTQRRALINLRAAAFCWIVAMTSETEGASRVVPWICKFCHMTEEEAAESIAIGRRLIAKSP